MTTFCFDLDGTLCTNTWGAYDEAEPFDWAVDRVRALGAAGHRIVVFTARGSGTGRDWEELTRAQLDRWGVPFDELRLGKPEADVFVDDRTWQTDAYRWGRTVVVAPRGATSGGRARRLREHGLGGLAPPGDVTALEIGRTFGGRPTWAREHVEALLGRGEATFHDATDVVAAVESAASVPDGVLGDVGEVIFSLTLAASPHAAFLDLYEPDVYPALSVSCRPLSQPAHALRALRDGHGAVRLGDGGWPVHDGEAGWGGHLCAVVDGTLAIPDVQDVTLRKVVELHAGEVRVLASGDLERAEELLVVSAPFPVLAASFGDQEPGPVTGRLARAVGGEAPSA